MQRTAMHAQRNAMERAATQCNATQRNATQCNAAQRNAVDNNATQRNAYPMQCNATRCRNATHCNDNANAKHCTAHATR
eukprot:8847538-Lingulodinium_polyedra.AAC.1